MTYYLTQIYLFFASVNLIFLGLSVGVIYFMLEMVKLMEEAKKNSKYFQVIFYILLWLIGAAAFGFTIVNSFPYLKN
jgi:small neutral amino acid transporter SnatA (MarC family)